MKVINVESFTRYFDKLKQFRIDMNREIKKFEVKS